MDIKVSIIIPVYNVELYLRQCIESAINQTLKEIEVIAIDDGSTDNSLDILKEYSKKYNFIKVIKQENKGVSEARNIGVKEAKGEYIYFLDSDDYIEIEAMEYSYQVAKKENLDIVTFDANVFLDNCNLNNVKNNYERSKLLESKTMSGEEFYCYSWRKKGYRVPIWLNLYRRDFLQKKGIKFYEGIIHEDELYTMETFILANKVMYIPKKFFNRRIRQNSIMTTNIGEENIKGMNIVAQEAYNFYLRNRDFLQNDTNQRLLKNIIDIYSKVIMYHDKIYANDKNKIKDRNKIIESFYKTKIVSNKRLNLQIKMPNIYYKIYNLEKNIKNLIKGFI